MATENDNPNPGKPPSANQKSPSANKSTGPRTPAGKRRSCRNARKHGLYSTADFLWDAAVATGEDPREYGRLLEGLIEARRPADALEMALVEEIALLFSKRMHLERTELAIQVCSLRKHDLERRKLFMEVGEQISNTSQSEMREKGLRTCLDAPGKFEQTLAILNMLTEMVEENDFSSRFQDGLRTLYGAEPSLRGVGMLHTYLRLTKVQPEGQEFEDAKTMMRLRLTEETKDVLDHYELFLHEHVEGMRAARLAATAPSHAQWAIIIRQENALHRQLERKIRLLMEIQEARKRGEQQFLDRYEASLHRKPSGGRDGGGQGGAMGASCLVTPTQDAAPAQHAGLAADQGGCPGQTVGASGARPRAERRTVGASGARPRAERRSALPPAESQPAPQAIPTLPPLGERVDRTGAFSSRGGPGEGVKGTAHSAKTDKLRTANPRVRASCAAAAGRCGNSRNEEMLNRRNELKVLVQTNGLSNRACTKRTPFCAPKAAFRAKECAYSTRLPGFEPAVMLGQRRLLGAA